MDINMKITSNKSSKKKFVVKASKSITAETSLTGRSLQKRGKNRYRILYSEIHNAPDADPNQMMKDFEAEISVSNPYDDAEYFWAVIKNGVIKYIRNGKVVDKSYYMTADDWDVENEEWCDEVITQALDNLEEMNRSIEQRIIHNSKDIQLEYTGTYSDGGEYKRITKEGMNIIRKAVGGDKPSIEYLRDHGYIVVPSKQPGGEGTWEVSNTSFNGPVYDFTKAKPITSSNSTNLEQQLINELTADNIDINNEKSVVDYLQNQFGYTRDESFELFQRIQDSFDDGYWFFTRHGVQPGSVPRDVDILDILDTPNGTFVKLNRFLSTKELDYYDLVERAPETITSDENVFDDIKEIGQEFTSENTSSNSKKLPAIFNMVHFNPGTVNLDYGRGRFDNVAEYLEQYDVINLVYDPYNRSSEHNNEVIRVIREHGGADTATCSNVLNVIKEPEVRENVLKNISKLVKPGGTVYITVYEGKGTGAEGPTKSGYQLNRKTADCLEEIQKVFPDAKRKGKLIVCTNSSSVTSSIESSTDALRLEDITSELEQKVKECMMSEEFGFTEDEVPQYSAVDVYMKDDRIVCEIRGELSFDGLMEMCECCNEVIEKYDPNAYFDPEEPGIATAYLEVGDNMTVEGSQSITALEDSMIDPPDYDEPDEISEEFEIEVDLNSIVIQVDDQEIDFADESEDIVSDDASSDDFRNEYGMYIDDISGVEEKLLDLIEKDIPAAEGKYKLSGYAYLVYDVSGIESYKTHYGEDDYDEEIYTDGAERHYNPNKSYVKDLKVRKTM